METGGRASGGPRRRCYVDAVMEANEEFRACAVCGRTILRGERASDYVDGNGSEALVCVLCKPRAEASGWVPAAYADTVTSQEGGRRRVSLAAGLRERFARRAERDAEDGDKEKGEVEPLPEPPDPLEVFNASGEARTVAGLVRSLGEPRVSVREAGGGEAVIVVAWDLSWYRWRVSNDEVHELAKGNEIEELPLEDRAWNASAADDGTLSLG